MSWIGRLHDGPAAAPRPDERCYPGERLQGFLPGAVIGSENQTVGIDHNGQETMGDRRYIADRTDRHQPAFARQTHLICVDETLDQFDDPIDTGSERFESIRPTRPAGALLFLTPATGVLAPCSSSTARTNP